MTPLRTWRRESRLLLIVAELAKASPATMQDVLTVDFLLQHPSLLNRFPFEDVASLPSSVRPSDAETDSSEEALLRWKRSVLDRILHPMIGRLIARGLITGSDGGSFRLHPRSQRVAEQLRESLGEQELARLQLVGAQVAAASSDDASAWLRAALGEEATP
jgi:hypothetical protein